MSDPNAGLPAPPPEPVHLTALDVSAAQSPGPLPATVATTAEEKAAQEISQTNNPAESLQDTIKRMLKERGVRVSLDSVTRKLEVPPLPGFHLHWFLESNVPRALAAWYEFVDPAELPTADRSIGGRPPGAKSEDIGGSQLRQIGGIGPYGKPEDLVLMKIRQDFYFEDQRKLAERNLAIIKQIFHKKAPLLEPGEKQTDSDMRYTREAILDMSNGRFRKA